MATQSVEVDLGELTIGGETKHVVLELVIPKNPVFAYEVFDFHALTDNARRAGAAALYVCGQGKGRGVWKGLKVKLGDPAALGAKVFGHLVEAGAHPMTIYKAGRAALDLVDETVIDYGLPSKEEVEDRVGFSEAEPAAPTTPSSTTASDSPATQDGSGET